MKNTRIKSFLFYIKNLLFPTIPAQQTRGTIEQLSGLKNLFYKDSNAAIIDTQTWHDLEMQVVFEKINRCTTPLGQQKLFISLHEIHSEHINNSLSDYRKITENGDDLVKIKKTLAQLESRTGYNVFYFLKNYKKQHTLPTPVLVICSLAAMATTLTAALGITPTLLPFAFLAINFVLARIGEASHSADAECFKYINKISSTCKRLHSKKATFPPKDEVLLKNNAFKTIKHNAVVNALIADKSNYSELQFFVMETINNFFLLEAIGYSIFSEQVNKHKEIYFSMAEAIATLDKNIEIAEYISQFNTICEPHISNNDELSLSNLYHPLLDKAVSNSINLGKNVYVLTGANMSGKSTFLKAVGISYILGKTLGFCHARSAALPHGTLLTALSIRDSVAEGFSYFQKEMLRVKEIIDSCQRTNGVYMLDEPFKGTNRPERIAAIAAIAQYLDGKCIIFITTHDPELGTTIDNARNFHFGTVRNESLNIYQYDYTIRNGISQEKLAIEIMKNEGFPQDIIDAATRLSSTMPANFMH